MQPVLRGGAKAILITVLGEFALPSGGSAWTSTLVEAAALLGIGEKNARQAIARIGDDGLISPERHGREVKWALTPAGRALLESGARRIYGFGMSPGEWGGEWLVTHCPLPESQRARRSRLRTRLAFQGFGELSPSLLISPHVDREPELREVLDELELAAESVVLRSTASEPEDVESIVARAWDLDALARSYDDFDRTHASRRPVDETDSFVAVVQLVHDWRRFPSIDPELPAELLPARWAGRRAAVMFTDHHDRWSPAARRWFTAFDLASEA